MKAHTPKISKSKDGKWWILSGYDKDNDDTTIYKVSTNIAKTKADAKKKHAELFDEEKGLKSLGEKIQKWVQKKLN
jgi:hypothetical protein